MTSTSKWIYNEDKAPTKYVLRDMPKKHIEVDSLYADNKYKYFPHVVSPRMKNTRNRELILEQYIENNDIIHEDFLHKLSYNNVENKLKHCAKKYGVQFEYIGEGKYVILK